MTTEDKFFIPLSSEVLLLDDPDYTVENGVIVSTPTWRSNLDYWVVRGSGDGYGVGDRVILDDPVAGRKLKINKICFRVVPKDHVVAVVS